MTSSRFKDKSGFRLQFEKKCDAQLKEFFMSQYELVDDVAKEKLHCSSCDIHIGTAPSAEKQIRTHTVLGVTQCLKCYTFYNSGEFEKQDGSEIHCRWCGQGGTVLGCSACPYVFCSTCISSNFSEAVLKKIKKDKNWRCFSCNKEPIKKLQAQHWALFNFVQKQIKEINSMKATTEVEKRELRKKDSSTCCELSNQGTKPRPSLKRKPSNKDQPAGSSSNKEQTAGSSSNKEQTAESSGQRKSKRLNTVVKVEKTESSPFAKSNPPRTTADNNISPSSTTAADPPSAAKQIFQQVYGFKIDLNAAALKKEFIVPDGAVIRVTKKASVTGAASSPSDFDVVLVKEKPKVVTRQPTTFKLQSSDQFKTHVHLTKSPYPDTPLGKAMMEVEDNLKESFTISVSSTNKSMTLSRTERFKSPESMWDAKDLFESLKFNVLYMKEKLETLSQNIDKGMQKVMENLPVVEASEDMNIVEDAIDVVDLLSDDEVPEI